MFRRVRSRHFNGPQVFFHITLYCRSALRGFPPPSSDHADLVDPETIQGLILPRAEAVGGNCPMANQDAYWCFSNSFTFCSNRSLFSGGILPTGGKLSAFLAAFRAVFILPSFSMAVLLRVLARFFPAIFFLAPFFREPFTAFFRAVFLALFAFVLIDFFPAGRPSRKDNNSEMGRDFSNSRASAFICSSLSTIMASMSAVASVGLRLPMTLVPFRGDVDATF